MYQTGQFVRFNQARCACVGGGFMEAEGKIVGALHNGEWYQIDQPMGIIVVKREHIVKVLTRE